VCYFSVLGYLENEIQQEARVDSAPVSCILLPDGQALLHGQKYSEKPGSSAQSKLAYWCLSSGLIHLKNVILNQSGVLFCDVAFHL